MKKVLVFVMSVMLLVSSAYLVREAGHHCSHEEDCPVCRNIAVNIRLLRTIGLAALILPLLFLLPAAHAAYRRQDRDASFCPGTLVSWKIRLND